MWQGQMGQIKETVHRIDFIPSARRKRQQPYRAGPDKRKIIEEHIKGLLEANVIEPAHSPSVAPVVIVYQPNKVRFCIDYRRLNNLTVKDRYPLPRLEDCLDSLGKAKWFKILDCNRWYWQVSVSEEVRDKIAIVSHCGQFRWESMQFRLTNAPGTFQRAAYIILAHQKLKTCLVYLDNIIVLSEDFESYKRHVSEIISLL